MKFKWLINPIVLALLIIVASLGLAGHDAVVAAQDESAKIEGVLLDAFTLAGNADFIVRFSEQADLSAAYTMDWNSRGVYVYNTLRATADKSQGNAKAILEAAGLKYQTMIGGNDLYVWRGTVMNANALAALPEVYFIRFARTYYIDPVELIQPLQNITWAGDYLAKHALTSVDYSTDATTDWGITDSKADQAWSLGARGAGIKVANIDTGVQWDHPALINQFACAAGNDPNCWADPSNICGGTACDNNGHGTHTMGTMVAQDDPTLPYIAGMAPDATWIACKGCESSSCSSYALTTCADWILAPNGNPANRPNVVNNSWGSTSDGNPWYLSYVNAWRAAGVFPAFSAGNNGSSCDSMGDPGSYQESFASAAHANNRTIASFSSRGPSAFGHDPYTKPNLSAPGVSICSTVPTDNWNCGYSGTSMASPHTAGAVAQLWSCAPDLVGQIDATFQALQDYADPPPAGNCGAPPDGEGNYTYGYGYLDVLSMVNANCGIDDTGILEGHVYDQDGNPVQGATVTAQPAIEANGINATTDPTGFYSMDLTQGTYQVTASKLNYSPQTVTGVEVLADQTTVQDFTLVYLGSWTQIALPAGCPDWMRYDGEYYPGNGLVYFLGGRSGTITYGDIYTFNPVTQSCADTGANIPTPISNYTIVSLNDGSANLLCSFGGRDASGSMTLAVQCYDPMANSVSAKADLPNLFTGFLPGGAAVVNNKAYIFGGFRSSSAPYNHAYTYEYDPLANTYTQRGDLNLGRGYIEVAVVDGLVYAFGGDTYDGTGLVAQTIAEVFDPTSGTWNNAAVADLLTPSGEGRGFGFDSSSGYELAGKIVLAGGGIWQADTYVVLLYDISSKIYVESFPDLNIERRDQAAFFVTGDLGAMWVLGGYSAAAGYEGDNPPYAPPEYFEVALVGPPVPDILVTPASLTTELLVDGSAILTITINNLGQAALDWDISDNASWVSENPTFGSVQSSGSVTVDVVINASGLTPGQYLADLNIHSNDPQDPVVTVPVTLNVFAAEPDIGVSPLTLEMTLLTDQTGSSNFTIINAGNSDLNWSLSDDAIWLSEAPISGVILPDGSIEVVVTFDSAGLPAGQYPATIEVNSNDPDQTVVSIQVTLTVVASDIEVTAPPLEITLLADQIGTLNFSIANIGSAGLDWSVTDGAAWLSEAPDSGSLLPDGSIEITVTFDSTGLASGVYETNVVINSNDPDEPELSLPASLTVVEPDIVVTAPPMEMTLLPDQTGVLTFTIANLGTYDLTWNVTDEAAWLSELPLSGVILPGQSMEVQVTFDSGGLTYGIYETQLLIRSDDPDQPEIMLPATLTVLEPDIILIASPLEMTLFPDETGWMTITLENIGNADLVWSIDDSVAWLGELPESGSILPVSSTDVTITFDSAGLAPGVFSADVVISSNDPDEAEIILPATLTVEARQSDLSLIMIAHPEAVKVAETITYTLVVTNLGPQAAAGIMLVDTLPLQVTFASASPGCTAGAGAVTCDIGALAVGESISLSIVVNAVDVGMAGNTAVVSSDNVDPDLSNNAYTVNTTIYPMIFHIYVPMLQRH